MGASVLAPGIRAKVEVAMDSKKIKRVRRLIAGNFYTDPEVLDTIEEILVERRWELIVRDINKCNDVCILQNNCDEKAAGVHAEIMDDLMQYTIGEGDGCHNILADIVAGSLRKLASLIFAGNTMTLRSR